MKSDRCASFHSSDKQSITFQLELEPSKEAKADLVVKLKWHSKYCMIGTYTEILLGPKGGLRASLLAVSGLANC